MLNKLRKRSSPQKINMPERRDNEKRLSEKATVGRTKG